MTYFTTDNTDGFSADELATLNAAFDRLCPADADDDTRKGLGDRLNNAWFEGATADDLVRAGA